MKAKDYAKMYIESSDRRKKANEIASAFLLEIKTIAEARNIQKTKALIPIYNELNQKWKKFVSLVGHTDDAIVLRYDGFENMVRSFSPELHSIITAGHLAQQMK